MNVVDRLEMVEVEQEQRDVAFFDRGFGDHPLAGHEQRAAIEETRQRIGVGKVARALLGLGSLADFAVEIVVAAPAEEDQRDVEHERGREHAVGSAADADQRADDGLHDIAARADKQQDRGDDDAPGDDVAFGALAAVHWLWRRYHMNLSHPRLPYAAKR